MQCKMIEFTSKAVGIDPKYIARARLLPYNDDLYLVEFRGGKVIKELPLVGKVELYNCVLTRKGTMVSAFFKPAAVEYENDDGSVYRINVVTIRFFPDGYSFITTTEDIVVTNLDGQVQRHTE